MENMQKLNKSIKNKLIGNKFHLIKMKWNRENRKLINGIKIKLNENK